MQMELVVVDVRVALEGDVLPFAVVQKVDVLVVLEFVAVSKVDLVHLLGCKEVVLEWDRVVEVLVELLVVGVELQTHLSSSPFWDES